MMTCWILTRIILSACQQRFLQKTSHANISLRDLAPFKLPSYEEIKDKGIIALHLGNYVFWDGERQTEILRDLYGWQEDDVEGTYKRYKSVECVMPGVHDFTKFLKRDMGEGLILLHKIAGLD